VQTEGAKEVVVVTGAASGIGAQLTSGLARDWTVVACDLPERLPEIEALAAEHGTVAVGGDVSKPEDVDNLFAVAGRSGRLRGAVSCAGVLAKAYLSETTPEVFDHLVDVNLKGNFLVMRAAHRALRAQGTPGSVVVVSSINALIGLPSQAVYSAAKAAANSLVSAAAVEGGPYGIRVNAIAPGSTRTAGMNPHAGDDPAENLGIPMRRVGLPGDMVGPVRFLLSDESAYVTGCVLTVDGGLMHMRGQFSLR
jgi:NAD(P)-dependent dehydrogenase (short-subunit alcohol dehydrogenase family)